MPASEPALKVSPRQRSLFKDCPVTNAVKALSTAGVEERGAIFTRRFQQPNRVVHNARRHPGTGYTHADSGKMPGARITGRSPAPCGLVRRSKLGEVASAPVKLEIPAKIPRVLRPPAVRLLAREVIACPRRSGSLPGTTSINHSKRRLRSHTDVDMCDKSILRPWSGAAFEVSF
jgi:hypothetical protein